jgi:RNA polymerase sigma-70 factor, ECF subfamily
MAAPRLAPALAVACADMRAGSGARHARKSLRRAGQPARESSGSQPARESSGSRAKPGTDDPGRRTRSVKVTQGVSEVSLDDDSAISRQRGRADRSRRASENRPATAGHVRGIDQASVSGNSVRTGPAPERAAAAAMHTANTAWAHEAILAEVPKLRAFAISLCGNLDQADDFVQETLLRAWTHIDQFQRGTNMAAWLFTILRNSLRSNYRKYRREIEDADGSYAERMITHPEQNGRLEFEELRGALAKLPSDQRETLILVVASGASYEEAAEICGCRVGTIKSRVHRARARLAQIMAIDSVDDFAPDRTTQAVLRGAAG